MTTTTNRNETVLARAIDRWNAGDLDGYLEVYDEDVRLHGLAPEPLDKAGARAFYQGIFTAFPGCRIDLDDVFGADERLTCRFSLSGTHAGPFLGVPATGRPIVLPGITVLRFREGRCVERWTASDMLGLLVQIGAVAPPG